MPTYTFAAHIPEQIPQISPNRTNRNWENTSGIQI
jgi:hypothetical protein